MQDSAQLLVNYICCTVYNTLDTTDKQAVMLLALQYRLLSTVQRTISIKNFSRIDFSYRQNLIIF